MAGKKAEKPVAATTRESEPHHVEAEIVDSGASSQALTPIQRAAMPMLPVEEVIGAFEAYQRLQARLDEKMPDQILDIRGKRFRKKGYWRAVKVAFGLSTEVLREQRILTGANDWGYVFTVRALAPSGMHADGDGACMASEKGRGGMQATEHNVRSHAKTRATNRAISDLVGFGEVSADELSEHEEGGAPAATTADPFAANTTVTAKIASVESSKGVSKKTNKPYSKHVVTLVGGGTATTFQADIAKLAKELQASGEPCSLSVKAGKYGYDIEALTRAGASDGDETIASGTISAVTEVRAAADGKPAVWGILYDGDDKPYYTDDHATATDAGELVGRVVQIRHDSKRRIRDLSLDERQTSADMPAADEVFF